MYVFGNFNKSEKCFICFIQGKKRHNDKAKQRPWRIVYRFQTTPYLWKDFEEMCKYQQESEKSFLKYNAITTIQKENGSVVTWGLAMCKKKYIDPYTEEILSTVKAKDETEFKNMIKKEMGIDIAFDLSLKDRDFTGFTENKECCTLRPNS